MSSEGRVFSFRCPVFSVATGRAGCDSPSPWGEGRGEGELRQIEDEEAPYGRATVILVLLALAVLPLLSGCVTKAKAQADARNAFIAGQQEAVRHLQQNQVPTVTIIGQVTTPTVAWSQDLTLAQALITASYTGRSDPSEIIIVRRGVAQRIDPKKLLAGEDIPLQPGDIIQIKQ